MKNYLRLKNAGGVVVSVAMALLFMQVVAEHSAGASQINSQQAVVMPAAAESLQGRQVTLEATGYTCGPESTGKHPSSPDYCQTASGYRLKPGDKVAAMGEKYPFGTSVVVPGYGVAIVRDRGGAVSDNHIDLFFEQHEDALKWGRRMVTVTVR